MPTKPHFSLLATSFAGGPRPRNAALIVAGLWLAIFFAALFTPPLLDDADATHAQAARHVALTGDLVTLRVDGVRYLEKAPLPYWLAALSFRIFGFNTFAAHLPQAIAVLLLALLAHRWANQAFGSRTAFYAAIAILTAAGTFLFTRILIPEALLSLLLATALFAFLKTLTPRLSGETSFRAERPSAQSRNPRSSLEAEPYAIPSTEQPAYISPAPALYPYLMWGALALAVLTKGLVALVFFTLTTAAYLRLTGTLKASLPRLKPLTGLLLFLAIAGPWHIVAALHNPATPTHPGFLWFYFWNEHVLRFLGRRTPADFNRLPACLYWLLHLVWLFPWSLFLPLGIAALWRRFRAATPTITRNSNLLPPLPLQLLLVFVVILAGLAGAGGFTAAIFGLTAYSLLLLIVHRSLQSFHDLDAQDRTILLLSLFAVITLLFFSLSTNQEYYTFPIYLPILLLVAATITRAEQTYSTSPHSRRWVTFAHAAFLALGLLIALVLAAALIASRNLRYTPDIGALLAHRHAANDTLSMSHFLDLDLPAFAALRLPSVLAALALTFGSAIAWLLRMQRRHIAATTAIAFTAAAFLIAAHLALSRFAPLLSSKAFADRIQQLGDPHAQVIIYGDQAYGSTLPFYLGQPVQLVDGRTTSLLFGSRFEDAPPIFMTSAQLAASWGRGPRKLLFLPLALDPGQRQRAATLTPQYPVLEQSNKLLITDRPLP